MVTCSVLGPACTAKVACMPRNDWRESRIAPTARRGHRSKDGGPNIGAGDTVLNSNNAVGGMTLNLRGGAQVPMREPMSSLPYDADHRRAGRRPCSQSWCLARWLGCGTGRFVVGLLALWLLVGCSPKSVRCPPLRSIRDYRAEEAPSVLAAERCSEPTPQPGICGEDGLCLENPAPADEDFYTVWGIDSEHVWVGGKGGTIVFWNGKSWRRQVSTASRTLSGTVVSMWGSSANDVWAVERSGTLHHFDGASWRAQPLPFGDVRLAAVWGTAAEDVWLQARDGTLLRGNARGWNLMRAGTASADDSTPRRMGGSSGHEVWAFQSDGTAAHWDGRQLQPLRVPSGKAIHSLWGTSEKSVWGLSGGELWHWDGGRWSAVGAGPDGLTASWGFSERDIWGVGSRGIVHFDGSAWQPAAVDIPGPLQAIWGSRSDDVWAVGKGGTLVHFDGQRWSGAVTPLASSRMGAIWGGSAHDVWAVGGLGRILHWDGARWCQQPSGVTAELFALWGHAADDLWAAGSRETLLHWNGQTWRTEGMLSASPRQKRGTVAEAKRGAIYGLWGDSSTSVWAVGEGGLLRHFDGQTWIQSPGIPCADLMGIWGASANDVWVVGRNGIILHWDGLSWRVAERQTASLTSVWGRSRNDVWAAGLGGVVLHFAGEKWEPVTGAALTPDDDWSKVWGSASGEIWLVGRGGLVRRSHGDSWQTLLAPTNRALTSLWSSGDGHLWMGGVGGVLIHRAP